MTETLDFFKSLTGTGYLFLVLTAITLFSAIGVVTARNPIYSVLALIATFFCLSAHYILLNAQFLAAVNIIVYAGAIMVLFLFTIMFLNLRREDEESKTNLSKMIAVVMGGILMVMLITIFRAKSAQVPTVKSGSFSSQTGLVENLGTCSINECYLKRKWSRAKPTDLQMMEISSSVYKNELQKDLVEDRDSFAIRLCLTLLRADRPDTDEPDEAAESQDARLLHQTNARWRIDGSTFIDLIGRHR